MSGEIELDDIQVVEVTGKAYRDRRPRNRSSHHSCSPSLRVKTILIFLVIGLVYVLGVVIANIVMRKNLEELDRGSCDTSINRLAFLIFDDMNMLKQLVRYYSITEDAVAMAMNPDDDAVVNYWVSKNLNITYTYDEDGNMIVQPVYDEDGNIIAWAPVTQYSPGLEINFWALLDTNFNTLRSVYYPQGEDKSILAGFNKAFPPPEFTPEFLKSMVDESENKTAGWLKMHIPYTGDASTQVPFIVSLEPIMRPPEKLVQTDPTVYGYIAAGRNLKPRMKGFSDNVPSCISMADYESDLDEYFDKTDRKMFKKVTPGSLDLNRKYAGTPSFMKRPAKEVKKNQLRVCPEVPLFGETDNLMVGYMKLCGEDPTNHEHPSCVAMRLDRPMSMVDQGTLPVVYLSLEIIVLMVVLCVVFVLFLDCVVLRRIANLSNVIRKQTRSHAEALKDNTEDDSTQTSVHEDNDEKKEGSHSGRKGKSARGSSDNSRTSGSSDGGAPGAGRSARDEIGNLKRIMEQNAQGLRKRLEAVNDCIKIEQQKTIHHKQAMQLLNLWCGRKDYFPGLRPNAMQLRYEPTRSLDDLLANPLAIEYLKSHCDSDRTLENLWFLLDVSWLQELETAEDKEEDAQKRKQIHDVCTSCALTILSRYIAVNAPQQINISAATFKSLRDKGDVYERGMFEGAVGEVKLMLNTDILPRFQKSTAYSAMSETLYIDSSGGGDESEFSDETVSTAGSILTDEGEENEGGVARVFAHTFKNLHNTFDVGHDTDASSTYSADSSRATGAVSGPSASVVLGTQTTTTGTQAAEEKGAAGEESSKDSKDGSSVSLSEKSSEGKKEEPKKAADAKKAAESAKSSDSSSSGSTSSDSVSSSDSSSSSD